MQFKERQHYMILHVESIKKRTHRKKIRLVVTRGEGWGREINEHGQKVQISCYKINKY